MDSFKNVWAWARYGPVPRSQGEGFKCKNIPDMVHKVLDKCIKKSRKAKVLEDVNIIAQEQTPWH